MKKYTTIKNVFKNDLKKYQTNDINELRLNLLNNLLSKMCLSDLRKLKKSIAKNTYDCGNIYISDVLKISYPDGYSFVAVFVDEYINQLENLIKLLDI